MAVKCMRTLWQERNDSVTTGVGAARVLRPITTSDIRRFVRFPGDVRSESAQRLGKARITAVDVKSPTDRGNSIGDQSGDDQRGPGPDVAGLNGGTREPIDPVQHD